MTRRRGAPPGPTRKASSTSSVGGRRGDGAVRVLGKSHKPSSRRWLERQFNDAYVVEARHRGYRSRSAFKLLELDDRFRFLRPGHRVLDLGAAPGGWTQVATERVRAGRPGGGRVVALDLRPMDPLPDAIVLLGDADDEAELAHCREALGGAADVVLSDMAPASSGHPGTDHLRIIALAETAIGAAQSLLAPGGAFVCKVFQGGAEGALLAEVKRCFAEVRHAKPPASRSGSAEIYLVATGFRPGSRTDRR